MDSLWAEIFALLVAHCAIDCLFSNSKHTNSEIHICTGRQLSIDRSDKMSCTNSNLNACTNPHSDVFAELTNCMSQFLFQSLPFVTSHTEKMKSCEEWTDNKSLKAWADKLAMLARNQMQGPKTKGRFFHRLFCSTTQRNLDRLLPLPEPPQGHGSFSSPWSYDADQALEWSCLWFYWLKICYESNC